MGVACQILVNNTKDGVHRAGQAVSGIVKYAIDKPTEFKFATIFFLGTGKCGWKVDGGQSYSGTEKLITIKQDILSQKTEFVTLDVGSYEYPFEFPLPEDLPSTFKDEICTINYCIKLTFMKSSILSIPKNFVTKIYVQGCVEPVLEGPVIFGLEKTLIKLFSAEKPLVNLKATVLKTGLNPGENAELTLEVTNNTEIIPFVKTSLFCHKTYTADCGKTETSIQKIKKCSSEKTDIPVRSVTHLSHTIPTTPDLYSITSKVMKREYKVRVEVRFPLPHANAMVEMPVAIREVINVKSEASSLESPESEVKAPPSYWEVMSEEGEKEFEVEKVESGKK